MSRKGVYLLHKGEPVVAVTNHPHHYVLSVNTSLSKKEIAEIEQAINDAFAGTLGIIKPKKKKPEKVWSVS